MKKQIFYPAFALLLTANLFVFCGKEPQSEFLEAAPLSTEASGERAPCYYKIYGNVRVCGTLTSSTNCTSCAPDLASLVGNESVQTYWGSPLQVGPGLKLKVCNPSGSNQSVKIVTSSGSQVIFQLANGNSRNVKINEDCTITLGTTCTSECNI